MNTRHLTILSLLNVMVLCVCIGCEKSDVDGDPDNAKTSPPPPQVALTDQEVIDLNNNAVGLMGQYDYEGAHAIFKQLTEERPTDADIKVNLGIATLNRQRDGDEANAVALFIEVLKDHPDHLRANYCLGVLKYYNGPPADPTPHFKAVVEADPNDAYAQYLYGRTLAEKDDLDGAFEHYQRAAALDPYLNSANYALQNLARRRGDRDAVKQSMELFQRLKVHPRTHTFDIAYRKMGPKAEARPMNTGNIETPAIPAGDVFQPLAPLEIVGGDDIIWEDAANPNATAVDIDHDGDIDLFLANCIRRNSNPGNLLLLNNGDATFTPDRDHPLLTPGNIQAMLWGDVNSDGLTDVYACRNGANMLFLQQEDGSWTDHTDVAGVSNGEFNTVDGALFDADHDGDLDIFCVNNNGPDELFSNNLNGTFRTLAADYGLAGSGNSRSIVIGDFDSSRDDDILILNDTPPHTLFLNERTWSYRVATSEAFRFLDAPIDSATAADFDADGRVDLLVNGDSGAAIWSRQDSDTWSAKTTAKNDGVASIALAATDKDGDGKIDPVHPEASDESLRQLLPVMLDGNAGPSLLHVFAGKAPRIQRPGSGRYGGVLLTFTGKEDEAESMRSNASGIGTSYAARVGNTWTTGVVRRNSSGPGQSLQPVFIGLGGSDKIDFLEIEWSDGIFQSELALGDDKQHTIEEIQRQKSSCPVLFAWNGTTYEFISDVLGVGGLGFFVEPGVTAPPRPHESFLLPQGSLDVRDGAYELRLGEPMEEVCYLDNASLTAIALPDNAELMLDERMVINGPEATGDAACFELAQTPTRAINDRGEDVTDAIRHADLVAADVGAVDRRFIGRLQQEHVLDLTFETPLDQFGENATLLVDGWVEYPYSQTVFAAWQADATYDAPTLQAKGADGQWVTVLEQFGYPAGMPRQMAVHLPELPEGTTQLRLRTNLEVYWDRIRVVQRTSQVTMRMHQLELASASLQRVGFPLRTTAPQRIPNYDWQQRAPFFDSRPLEGAYTRYGDVHELVAQDDDALVIFGPAEDVLLRFDATLPPLPADWSWRFVLNTKGWCKDMDLYTKDGDTVEPLPGTRAPDAEALQRQYTTRLRFHR